MIEDAATYRTKEQVLFDLAKALHFSPDALEANRKGRLAGGQAKQFSGRCAQPAILTVIWAAAPFLLWTGLTGVRQQLSYPDAFSLLLSQLINISQLMESQGRMGAVAMVGSILVCLGLAAYTATRISLPLYFDLLDRKVTVIEGRIVAREEQTLKANGRDPVEKYFFAVRNHYFEVNLAAFRAIENGSIYLVYVLPRSEVMVALEPKVTN